MPNARFHPFSKSHYCKQQIGLLYHYFNRPILPEYIYWAKMKSSKVAYKDALFNGSDHKLSERLLSNLTEKLAVDARSHRCASWEM